MPKQRAKSPHINIPTYYKCSSGVEGCRQREVLFLGLGKLRNMLTTPKVRVHSGVNTVSQAISSLRNTRK